MDPNQTPPLWLPGVIIHHITCLIGLPEPFNQGDNPICWAVCVAMCCNFAISIARNSVTTYSIQQLIECVNASWSLAEESGYFNYSIHAAFRWIQRYGLSLADDYPYHPTDRSPCSFFGGPRRHRILSGYREVPPANINIVLEVLEYYPVIGVLCADDTFMEFYNKSQGHDMWYTRSDQMLRMDARANHAVLIFGYRVHRNHDDILTIWFDVLNSHGPAWGWQGLAIVDSRVMCGFYYPILL